jgi:general secretion pathway protein D
MRLSRFLVVALLVVGLFAADERVTLRFKDLKINDFVKMVAKITDKNILNPYNISGKVNFISVKPIKKSEVFDLLINVLKTKGYTIVQSPKGYLMVVKSREALREAPPIYGTTKLEQIQTDIIGIRYVDVSKVYSAIVPMVSASGRASVIKDSNTLVVTDYPKNLRKIRQMVSIMDKRVSKRAEFVKLHGATVTELYPKVAKIAKVLFPMDMKLGQIEIVPVEATNTMVIVAKPEQLKRLRGYIKRMDQKDNVARPSIHIVKLKNADSAQLQKVLNDLIAKTRYEKNEFRPSVTIDQPTNSLIILATKRAFGELKKVIESLDVDRQQVYVRAKIVEISGKKAAELGAKYGILAGILDGSGLYTTSINMGGSPIAFDIAQLGIDTPTLTKGVALGAAISFLELHGAAKKLSEPTLLCVNNMESTIYVGRTESVIVQGTVGADATDYTKNIYSRQDIGLRLKIKPRISADKKVSLQIKTVLEDILPGSQVGLPTTSKREMETTTIVKNGQSIIIGGLVRDNLDKSISKLPLLGDLPLFGALFRHTSVTSDKTTLVILLTPYIVERSDDLERLRSLLGKIDTLERQFVEQMKKERNK